MKIGDVLDKLQNRQATIGVVGMGYVGVPLALSLAKAGFGVIGIDINASRIKNLQEGKLDFAQHEHGLGILLKKIHHRGSCKFSQRPKDLVECQAVVITVQTPLMRGGMSPDYHILKNAIRSVAPNLSPGTLLVIQSTVAPGTCRKELIPMVERLSRKKIGRDIWFCYVPERVLPGTMLASLRDLPRMIGADDKTSARFGELLYSPVTRGDIDAAPIETAEIAKTAENASRFLEIHFANALALVCENYGVSYQDVRTLCNQRTNIHLLQPGAGVGGHCIPKDPWLLVWEQRKTPLFRLFAEGARINRRMPRHVVHLLRKGFDQKGISLKGAHVAILGFSYKEGSDDTRATPAKTVVNLLRRHKVFCDIHDPLVSRYQKDLEKVISGKDAVLVMTAHPEYRLFPLVRLKKLLRHPVIIDGRQTWDPKEARQKGFTYLQIGDVGSCH